jgi:hypothetical protein
MLNFWKEIVLTFCPKPIPWQTEADLLDANPDSEIEKKKRISDVLCKCFKMFQQTKSSFVPTCMFYPNNFPC